MFVPRSLALRPFVFSLLVVSALSSKVLHLYQHAGSISPFLFALYFPTFFILEALLAVAAWFLLNRTQGVKSALATAVVGLLAAITLVASSSQLGFFFVTGAEVRWSAAKSAGNDPEGRKLLLSGLRPVLCSAVILVILSSLLMSGISFVMGRWLSSVLSGMGAEDSGKQLPGASLKGGDRRRKDRHWTLVAAAFVAVLWLVRPSEPYNHISTALPFALFSVLLPSGPPPDVEAHPFPYPDLLKPQFWEGPRGHYKGWAPKSGHFVETDDYLEKLPQWASGDLPRGFERWGRAAEDTMWSVDADTDADTDADYEVVDEEYDEEEDDETPNYYNPVTDPLRITNLDRGLLEPLEQALKEHDAPITHIAFVIMESARKDVFPFQSGSHLHQEILDSYENKAFSPDELNAKLSRMTPVARMLTGESTGFGEPVNLPEDMWRDSAEPGMGGINVKGMLTGSTLSFKSALVNYCGVGPLAVDFMMEADSNIYQPCIMQMFRLFNQLKDSEPSLNSSQARQAIQNRRWKSVFTQSITELYDKQNVLNRHMGFDQSVCREHIEDSRAKHYHQDMEEVNYFGYPETEVYPYIKDIIDDAVKNDNRLFLSHFTSTTHHPWNTPEGFPDENYFASDLLGSHDDMDRYLNTMRYVDNWLGTFMQLLDDTGIANETLVVFVGDHGQAFNEDSPVSGTYENGHISNFHIPVVFRHPRLPRIQVTANASTMSVVPTMLDLLVQTKSLNKRDSDIAQDLMNEYEGQSLIRPYKGEHNGRQAWNFGIINAGGTMLSVSSAAAPYRLILPLTTDFEYTFSHLEKDPAEQAVIKAWKTDGLARRVLREHGREAAQWVQEAEEVARWWIEDRKRLWNYHETT